MIENRGDSFLDFLVTLGGIISAGALMVNWAFQNFETKLNVTTQVQALEKRLERIEVKIDRIIEGSIGKRD